MKLYYYLLPVIFSILFSCSGKQTTVSLDEETYAYYLVTGGEISAQAQSALLSHVSGAMKEGGSQFAVEFCNLRASGITDSLNSVCNCTISRVTDRNRNPENGLETDDEKQLWNYFLSVNDTKMIHDTVLAEGQKAVYYKPILIGMPACLQCHGPADEIDPPTLSKIREFYPDDEATGYSMNELRGLWKIEFEYDLPTDAANHSSLLLGIFRDL